MALIKGSKSKLRQNALLRAEDETAYARGFIYGKSPGASWKKRTAKVMGISEGFGLTPEQRIKKVIRLRRIEAIRKGIKRKVVNSLPRRTKK